MGRAKPVILNTIRFENQAQALTFFKAMLNRYIPGERVSDEDALHLEGLLKRHADYNAKVARGLDHFGVMAADYGSQCFCAIGRDGSKADFSYTHCVTQRPR